MHRLANIEAFVASAELGNFSVAARRLGLSPSALSRRVSQLESLASQRTRPAGLLRVEAPTILGRHVVVPAVAKLVARHRELRVELTLRDHPGDLGSEGIDVGLRLGPLADSSLIARRLGQTKMRLCCAPNYLRRKGTPRSVAALERHECLGFAVHGRALP